MSELSGQAGGPSDDVLRDDGSPVVGRPGSGFSPLLFAGLLAVLAIALFLFLNAHRLERGPSLIAPAYAGTAPTPAPAPPPPLELPKAPQPVAAVAPAPPAPAPAPPQVTKDPSVNLKAPAVVVDLLPASQLASPRPAQAAGSKTGAQSSLSPNEQFAARTSEASPESSVATQLANLPTLITQGSTIPAVLETAINSDLPGYTRALVSRDIRGFDGKTVLIPRGSRVIGQYKNAMSVGQARVFIIWTRIIRPDGVSIQIGSPASDPLGRSGMTGDVNSHFFARFGGSVLLSLLNIAGAAATGVPSTQISIGSPQSAAGAAAGVSSGDSQIPPTINVPQGAPINIFVARDLDFSAVKRIP
jgi:type IV secretory pathway VirB10-like protein